MQKFRWIWVAIVCFPAFATWGTPLPWVVPSGLSTSSSYQLIFVTSGTRDALSSTLADYDNFVNQQADAAHIGPADFALSGQPIHWHAVVSVFNSSKGTSNAKETAVQTAPVYNLIGELVSTGGGLTTPLYQTLTHAPVRWSPDGTESARKVFTGTNFTGIASTTPAGTGSGVTAGNSTDIGETWLNTGFGQTQPAATPLPFYALSDAIVAPEPSSIALIFCGMLACVRRSRNRTPA